MNVILVVLDSLRLDHVGCYGNTWIKTPNLDAFAKESAFFITPNELECSRAHSEHYHLFRLFNFRKGPKLFFLKGDLHEQLWLEPNSYRAGVR